MCDVSVDVIQATDLSGVAGSTAAPNPYAVLYFQGSSGETEWVEGSATPFWNTNFCFDVEG